MSIYGPTPVIGSDNKYHYVYRITNLIENKHYYGSRTSTISPYDDLGKKYFSSASSPKNSWIKSDQKKNHHNYKYKIIQIFSTRKQAIELECKLHNKFDVSNSNLFYNESKQNGTKFDTTGKTVVIDKNGTIGLTNCDNIEYISGELKSISYGKIYVENSSGDIKRVDPTDPRYISGEYKKISMMTYKSENGKYLKVKSTDERVISGELHGMNKNMVTVRNNNGKNFNISKDDNDYISGKYVSVMEDLINVIDPNNNNKIIKINRNDPRYISGELKSNVIGINNPCFKYYRKTPWGIFDSPTHLEPQISKYKIEEWCGPKNDQKLSNIVYNNCIKLQETFGPVCVGKTFKELGFGNLTPEEYQQLQIS